MFPNPTSLIKGDNEIPQAEEVGTISLDELHKYNCNTDRRILSLFGTLFDVTSSEKGYGKDGACKCFVFLMVFVVISFLAVIISCRSFCCCDGM
jgi:hypothetical protein